MNFFDLQLIISSVLIILLGIAHNSAGIKAYIKGSDLNVFKKDSEWVPDCAKQNTLLGVFFMISLAWWQSMVLLIVLILIGNPISIWLAGIDIVFMIPQLVLLKIYVNWNKVAQAMFLVHILSAFLWLVQYL